jgi:hypothetical protein
MLQCCTGDGGNQPIAKKFLRRPFPQQFDSIDLKIHSHASDNDLDVDTEPATKPVILNPWLVRTLLLLLLLLPPFAVRLLLGGEPMSVEMLIRRLFL